MIFATPIFNAVAVRVHECLMIAIFRDRALVRDFVVGFTSHQSAPGARNVNSPALLDRAQVLVLEDVDVPASFRAYWF